MIKFEYLYGSLISKVDELEIKFHELLFGKLLVTPKMSFRKSARSRAEIVFELFTSAAIN
ncbi:MAG: hypothetical protein IPH96_09830 [Saprospiraceae bacterium]|nr:hypothetical protein [Saprospiraceae bacterium]